MNRVQRIKEFWNERAIQYGANQKATLGEIAVRHLEINEIKKHLDHGQKILDVGCGNGYTTKIFAKKYNSKLHGIDYSPEMIRMAKQSLMESEILGEIHFKVQDCLDLKFSNNYFDVIYTERCIQNLPELKLQEEAILELLRVLKPGGKLILVECSKTGLLKLNKIRKMIGRMEISDAEPWHNKFIDDNWLIEFAHNNKDIFRLEIKHFASTYTLLTRILPLWRIFYYFRYFQYIPNLGEFGYFKSFIILKNIDK
jgi:ubiquinone/menaquinone biosynthesis C-methylase UbiE